MVQRRAGQHRGLRLDPNRHHRDAVDDALRERLFRPGGRPCQPDADAVLGGLPLMALQFAMLLAINFPDAAGDAAVGKRTLVVRYGARTGAILRAAALAMPYLSLPVLLWLGLPPLVAWALLLLSPLALWQLY